MRNFKQTSQMWLAVLALGLGLNLALADTFVSGNVSGTWSKAGNRYIITGNISVPPGETLVIQPGVEVIIGQGLRIDVLGRILAEGTAAERITFRGSNPAFYWDKIAVIYGSAGDSSFVNCKFSEATNALFLNMDAAIVGTVTMQTPIYNCTFTNCLEVCIAGSSIGNAISTLGGYYTSEATLSPDIRNCQFLGSLQGCSFFADGRSVGGGMSGTAIGRGFVNATIANCVFKSQTLNALTFSVGSLPGTSTPQVLNNVFMQGATAVQNDDRDTFSDVVAYNVFYNNQTNFVGYPPGVHGTICCVNANGTPCDLLYNIFTDPIFANPSTFTLAANSPCIDAGNPAGAYLDTIFPPSQGATVNDIGLYGGPYATGSSGGTTNFTLTAQQYVGVTINPAGAGQYRLDYRHDVDSGIWYQATNVNLLSTPWTYIDFDSPGIDQRFYRAVKLP